MAISYRAWRTNGACAWRLVLVRPDHAVFISREPQGPSGISFIPTAYPFLVGHRKSRRGERLSISDSPVITFSLLIPASPDIIRWIGGATCLNFVEFAASLF